jgi:hypothetical protein
MAHRMAIPLTRNSFCRAVVSLSGIALFIAAEQVALGQAITISTKTLEGPIDRRYAQVEPTHVDLPKEEIDARGHQDILRVLTAEQGFAMRPLPRGKKGLTLVANGKLSPAGEGFMSMVSEQGLSVKPGDRVVLSNIRIDRDKLVFDINGGPEHKHEFMRHIQIGMGPNMTQPLAQDDSEAPTGSRITLTFNGRLPDVTPAQVKALLAPLISFDVKTPAQAYTDTLPPKLKEAILNHHVMVGMSTQMVLYALGQPESKSRELKDQTPFEEWIYGHPPQDVNFVRVNGNRVIRVEIARLGQPLEVFTQDEVAGLMTTDGKPVIAQVSTREHTIQLGDVHPDLDKQAPLAPPSLRKPGEKLPEDAQTPAQTGSRDGPMKPVMFPKDTTNDPAHVNQARPDKSQTAPADPTQPTPAKPGTTKPSTPDPAQQSAPPSPPNGSFLPTTF